MKRQNATKWFLLVPTLLVLVTVISMMAYQMQSYRKVRERIYGELSEEAQLCTDAVTAKLESHFSMLDAVLNGALYSNGETFNAYINDSETPARVGDFTRIGYFDIFGTCYFGNREISVADEPIFSDIISGNVENAIQLFDRGELFDENVLMLAVPFSNNGEPSGAVTGLLTGDSLFLPMTDELPYPSAYSFAFSKSNGMVVMTEKDSGIDVNSNAYDVFTDTIGLGNDDKQIILDDIDNGRQGMKRFSSNGEPMYIFYEPLAVGDWYYCLGVPANFVEAEANRDFHQGLFLMAIVFCCTILMFISVMVSQRKSRMAYEQLVYNSTHDKLTGLLNEHGFENAGDSILHEARRKYCIICLDIAGFKFHNMTLGADKGSMLLESLAQAINTTMGKNEISARLYADEFALLAVCNTREEVFDRIHTISDEFTSLANKNHGMLVNYGICEATEKPHSINYMISCARTAKAMIKGTETVGVYDMNMMESLIENSELTARVSLALDNNEFYAVYQPQYDAVSEKLVAAEALARWRTECGEIVLPGKFIGFFEESGKIMRLDFYMLETICKKLQSYIQSGVEPVPISVNFSRNHLYDKGFFDHLTDVVNKYGVSPKYIVLEFTETIIVKNIEAFTHVVEKLHAAGFRVSMDDFGSGYSSLAVLKDVSLDMLKLDKNFFTTAMSFREKCIVKSVFELSEKLKLQTVAEGVENKAQLDICREYGCKFIQGYYFSKPVSESEFDGLVSEKELDKEAVNG